MKEKVYDVRGFKFEDIMEESKKFVAVMEKIKYLKYVKKEWVNDPPEIDPNGPWAKPLDVRLENEIEVLEDEIEDGETEGTERDSDRMITKIKLPDGKGYADLVRIFEAMKNVEIIDRNTKVTEIAQLFTVDKETFTSNYYATRSGLKSYKHNSISNKLYKFIIEVIKEAYADRPNKRDELVEEIEKM